MRRRLRNRAVRILVLAPVVVILSVTIAFGTDAGFREWTSTKGTTANAKLTDFSAADAQLYTDTGRRLTVARNLLCDADNAFINKAEEYAQHFKQNPKAHSKLVAKIGEIELRCLSDGKLLVRGPASGDDRNPIGCHVAPGDFIDGLSKAVRWWQLSTQENLVIADRRSLDILTRHWSIPQMDIQYGCTITFATTGQTSQTLYLSTYIVSTGPLVTRDRTCPNITMARGVKRANLSLKQAQELLAMIDQVPFGAVRNRVRKDRAALEVKLK